MEPEGRYSGDMYIMDQIVLNFGLIYSVIIFIVFICRFVQHQKESEMVNEDPTRQEVWMKFVLFTVFISNILFSASVWSIVNLNSIIPNYEHSRNLTFCHILHVVTLLWVGCFLCSILTYYSLRLEVMLDSTIYQYPSKCYTIFRWITIITLMTVDILACMTYDGSYNVYVKSMDVIICSGVEQTQFTTWTVLTAIALCCIFILNMTIWYMFFKKLIMVIQSRKQDISKLVDRNNDAADYVSKQPEIILDEHQLELLNFIKKQTLLVGVICMSTVIFWGIRGIFLYGYFSTICDGVVNISCIFLSLGYTNNYYEKLRCNKLSDRLCGCVERYAIYKLIDKANAIGQCQPEVVIYTT